MNNKQGVFSMWLKNFCCLVFTQAFQAIFLAVIILVMGEVFNGAAKTLDVKKDEWDGFFADKGERNIYFVVSIVAYVGVTGLIKLDKLVRAIFQVEASPMFGDLSKEMKKLMRAGIGVMSMANNVKRGMGDVKANKERLKSASAATQRLALNADKVNALSSGSTKNINTSNTNTNVSINGNGAGYSRDQIAALFNDSGNFDGKGELIDRAPGEQMLYEAEKEKVNARIALSDSRRKAAVTALSTIAGLGIANGAYDDVDEIATVGAALSGGIGKLGDVATRGVTKRSARMTGAKELREADKLVASATDDNRKQMAKNAQAMNQAIADATKDVAKEFKISKPSIKKATAEVKKAADDWLNTDFQAAKSERISRADAKRSVRENVRNNSKKSD